MIDYFRLPVLLQAYRVTDDALMPWAYQQANPQGRPFHDDWATWPFTRILRRDTAFRVPLPFILVASSGPVAPRWMPWQEGYPESPGANFRASVPGSEAEARGCPREVLAHDPVLPIGQAATMAAYLNGRWVPCYRTSSSSFLGRRLHTNRGLKPDVTLGDFMTYLEGSLTWTKIA